MVKRNFLVIAIIVTCFANVCKAQDYYMPDTVATIIDDSDFENYNSYLDTHYQTTQNAVAENVALKFMNALLEEDYKKASVYKSKHFDTGSWADLITYLEGDLDVRWGEYANKVYGLEKVLAGNFEDAEPAVLQIYKTYIINSTGSDLLVRMRYYNDYDLKYNPEEAQYQYGSVKLVKEDSSWKVISYDF